MNRCKHGFAACYSCKLVFVHPTDCHYPDCKDRKGEGEKFCPKHGGAFAARWKEDEG